MLNLAFVFDDAVRAVSQFGDRLAIAPLPATIHLMQLDVINHYEDALGDYFTVSLEEPFMRENPQWTPYRKWTVFSNFSFELLSFAIHNLMRYTGRLICETELLNAQNDAEPCSAESLYAERKRNTYALPLLDIRTRGKSVGITILPEHRLSLSALRTGLIQERVFSCETEGKPTSYFRVVPNPNGENLELPIEQDEYERARENISTEMVDIRDRGRLAQFQDRGLAEIAHLKNRSRAFREARDSFYKTRQVTEIFTRMHWACGT